MADTSHAVETPSNNVNVRSSHTPKPLPPNIFVPPFYRRRPVVCVLIAAAILAAVVDHIWGKRQRDDYSRYHNRVFTVVNVVDGDTFDIDIPDGEHETTRIRLWGVDAPEMTTSRTGPMHYGPEAAAFAKQTLLGRPVRIELSPTKTRGLYGRLLAYVHLVSEGDSFNELLIENGHAYADWRFAHPLKKEYKNLEKRARRRGAGLWAHVKREDMPAWRQRTKRTVEAR